MSALPLHQTLGSLPVCIVNAAILLSLEMHRNIPGKLLKQRDYEIVMLFSRSECRTVFADGRITVQSGLLPTICLKRALNPLSGLRLYTSFALKFVFSLCEAHILNTCTFAAFSYWYSKLISSFVKRMIYEMQ